MPILLFRSIFLSALIGFCVAETCFETRDELLAAVEFYLQHNDGKTPGNSSSDIIATTYGWPIGTWCVSKITDFSELFKNATDFNEDLSDWDTSSATTMNGMFAMATSFNQPLDSWNVASVQDMDYMFHGALSFDQDLSSWDVSNVRSMKFMFSGAAEFNGDITTWNVERCLDMSFLFLEAESFDQDISAWQVSSQTNMNSIFEGAASFHQNLCVWGEAIFQKTGEQLFKGTGCPMEQDPNWETPSNGPFCEECSVETSRLEDEDMPMPRDLRLLPYKMFAMFVMVALVLVLRRVYSRPRGIDPSDSKLTEFELLQNMSEEVS